jgi:hypothetical protein
MNYDDLMYQKQEELLLYVLQSGDRDAIANYTTALEQNRLDMNWAVLAQGSTAESIEIAITEILDTMRSACRRKVERDYQKEMAEAVKKIAVERFYTHLHRICGVSA